MARESEAVAAMRRELGRQLAARRKAAGYVQRELGVLTRYSRTAIANAETGGARVGRQFWEHADLVLGTGELFVRGYDRVRAQLAAESRATAVRRLSHEEEPGEQGRPAEGLESSEVAEVRRACHARGWPVEEDADGKLWLVTGTMVDVLEVPHQAGMVAIGWWLYTRGVPDEIRGLPALPDPAQALAVVSAGPASYFLTRSGAFPWTHRDMDAIAPAPSARSAVVRWHADGSRILLPPSRLINGENAAWAHAPAEDGRLPSPMALLHVLAQVTLATREGTGLTLPGGVRALPAATSPLAGPK
jgi:hypothetical protein